MEEILENSSNKNKSKNKLKVIILILSLLVLFIFYYFFSAPINSKDVIIHISQGESQIDIFKELKDKNSIKNINSLKFFTKILNTKNKGVTPGDYLIKSGSPVWSIALQIVSGRHGINPVKITLREGLTRFEMADIFEKKIAGFNKQDFLLKTEGKEGYLFPDTYFIFPLDSTDEIIYKLSDNFKGRTNSIFKQDSIDTKEIKDIIIMASILEGEANGKDDSFLISGILWKRISIGMPLQVDVDKKTYKNKGLPSVPLNNPGLISIKAAMDPLSSDYLYYLHDKNGQVHFAETYKEHQKNITNYLK